MICVVSVVDSISTTSMPVNEFVIYRSVHRYPIKQIMIVCDTQKPDNVEIPYNIQVILTGNNKINIRNSVKTILRQCKVSGDKVVFHLHHQKSAITFFVATMLLGIRSKSLYTVHSTYSGRNLKYKFTSCYCVLMAKNANCVSNAAYQQYNSFVKKIKGKHFTAISNGVDTDRIDSILLSKIKYNDEDKRKTLICVGRMIPLKNHSFLIDLLRDLPEYRLILIGAKDPDGRVIALSKELGVADRIDFVGLIPRENVFSKLSTSGIYLSPSKVEGLPISVLEAMRVGLIPVISDILPHKEIADKCKEVCVLPFDRNMWLRKIKEYSEMPLVKFQLLQKNISSSVKENYSLEKMHCQYEAIYRTMIG